MTQQIYLTKRQAIQMFETRKTITMWRPDGSETRNFTCQQAMKIIFASELRTYIEDSIDGTVVLITSPHGREWLFHVEQ